MCPESNVLFQKFRGITAIIATVTRKLLTAKIITYVSMEPQATTYKQKHFYVKIGKRWFGIRNQQQDR